MAISTRPIGNLDEATTSEITKLIRETFADLEDQLNQRAEVYVSTDGKVPAGLQRDDLLFVSYRGEISILIKNSRGFDRLNAGMIGGLLARETNFLGYQESATAPTINNFPQPNDWGFFRKTTVTTTFHLCYNLNNVLFKVALT